MQNVSDKPVKWQDENDGWHVGFPVLEESGCRVKDGLYRLIRETPCGTLTWVDHIKITDYVVAPEFK